MGSITSRHTVRSEWDIVRVEDQLILLMRLHLIMCAALDTDVSKGPPHFFVSFIRTVLFRLFIYFCARDTSKASKKPFSIGVNRIDRRSPHDPTAARSDVKAEKSFIVARSGASTPW
jgi:hypothetical protein